MLVRLAGRTQSNFPMGYTGACGDTNIPPKPLHFDDSEHTWADGAVAGKFDIETVALHEIGHLLGLNHTSASGNIMIEQLPSNFTQRTLGADNLAGIRFLYPQPADDRIASRWSFKVLDVRGWSTASGAPIQQWDWHGGSNQLWRFHA